MEKKSESLKGVLPACVLSRGLIEELWRVLGREGEFIWQAIVGTGDDILGKRAERQQEIIIDREQLFELLASLPRIDSLQITAEMPDKGAISLSFLNYAPAGGALVISGYETAWVETMFDAIMDLFEGVAEEMPSRLYSRWIFGIFQTAIPLSVSCVLIMLAAAIFIPSSIRHSEWVWWITAGTVVVTLRFAYSISDWIVKYLLQKYPYIRWVS